MPVYFIRSGDTGPVKIGWTDDVEKRRKNLQTAHPGPLRVVRVIQCRRGTETWLKQHYKPARLYGEWFAFSPEMLTIEPPDLDIRPRQEPKRSWVNPDPRFAPAANTLAEALRVAGASPATIAGFAHELADILRREAAE